MRLLPSFLLCVLSVNNAIAANSSYTFSIINEKNHKINDVNVVINGVNATTNAIGEITLNLTDALSYQVTLTKEGFYKRVQTFSHKELMQLSSNNSSFTLVKRQPGRVMFAFGGDVMMGRRYYKPYFEDEVLIYPDSDLANSKAILAHMKPYLSLADMAVVNLESQLATHEPKQRAPKSVTFYSNPSAVKALKWAGIDYVTLGNNHTYDYLDEGLGSTLKALDGESLPYSGAGFTEQQALSPYIANLSDSTYAMLGFVGWQGSTTPKQTATSEHGGAAFGSMENITSSVKSAKGMQHLPIVQYHGSLEYKNEPTGVTEQRLKSAIDNGAVLAVAHHPHVAQGIELYKGKLIAYSMGNFVFDQNFNSTQHSFLLHVWLDNGEFHRAEIIPVYVKGYKPTPALDDERITILRRLHTLSAKRNTFIQNEQGIGVITPSQSGELQTNAGQLALDASTSLVHNLSSLPWDKTNYTIKSEHPSLKYRFGSNLINGSNFEQFSLFNAQERGFTFDKDHSQLISPGYNSTHAMQLQVEESQWLGMKHFRRVFNASSPMTFKMDVNAQDNLTLNVYWQGRKTRQKLFNAFNNSPKNLIASVEINGNEKWQHIELPFNSPRIGYKSYRVLAELVNSEGKKTKHITIDNFSLIEWQTAFQNEEQASFFNSDSKMSNFIGFNGTSDKPILISVK